MLQLSEHIIYTKKRFSCLSNASILHTLLCSRYILSYHDDT